MTSHLGWPKAAYNKAYGNDENKGVIILRKIERFVEFDTHYGVVENRVSMSRMFLFRMSWVLSKIDTNFGLTLILVFGIFR